MTDVFRKRAERWVERVLELPLKKQALCVFLAAEKSLLLWTDWEKQNGLFPVGDALCQCFLQWLEGKASDEQLDACGDELLALLPNDVADMQPPAVRQAGFALADVPAIALDKCEDVHDSIVWTAIYYAAASSCGTGKVPIVISSDILTDEECQFLSQWWIGCCQRVPELASLNL